MLQTQNPSQEISSATLVSDEYVEKHVETRADKQAQGKCVRKACRARAEDGSDYCKRHGRLQRAYQRAWIKRQREQWEAEERCTRCGADERKPGSKWCAVCLIRHPKARKRHVDSHVENRRSRVARRLIPWSNSPHNEGRMRMRGGKRGAPSLEELDRRDLDDIRMVLADYEAALGEAYAPEVRELTRDAQRSARAAAHAGLALAVRLGMEALVRNGYEVPVLAPDEIGDSDDESDT